MSQADLMGFTLPRKYGGLNCPNLIYTMATEIVSRADASFMNMFGLQGIAETVNAFASQEIKDEVLPRFAEGEVTGAMVLTEPDAGSDLQAVRLRAASGRERQLVPQRRQAIHHQRLRRDPADAGPQRTAHQRRPRAEPVHFRAVASTSRCGTWRRSWASTARRPANWSTTTLPPDWSASGSAA